MAPEVLRGEAARMQSDVYSFGILLWEMTARQVRAPHHSQSEANPRLLSDVAGSVRRPVCRRHQGQGAGRGAAARGSDGQRQDCVAYEIVLGERSQCAADDGQGDLRAGGRVSRDVRLIMCRCWRS
jgi:serine/threonine protein kinase